MNIVVIGLSHHSSPVELRERFAFAEAKIPDALKSLRESGIAGEAVILSTCNRVEIYAATSLEPARAFAELKQFLVRWGETPSSPNQNTTKSELEGLSPHQTDIRARCSSPSPRRGEGRGEEAVFSSSDPLTPALSPHGRGEGVEPDNLGVAELRPPKFTFSFRPIARAQVAFELFLERFATAMNE